MPKEFGTYSYVTMDPLSMDGKHPTIYFPLKITEKDVDNRETLRFRQVPTRVDKTLSLITVQAGPELQNIIKEVGNPIYYGGFFLEMVVNDSHNVLDFWMDLAPSVFIQKEALAPLTHILKTNTEGVTEKLRGSFDRHKPHCVITPEYFDFLTGEEEQFSVGRNMAFKRNGSVEIMGIGTEEVQKQNDWSLGIVISFEELEKALGNSLILSAGFRSPFCDTNIIRSISSILSSYNPDTLDRLDGQFRNIIEPYLKVNLGKRNSQSI